MCCECIVYRKRKCFNCEIERACKTCLDRISHKKTDSTNINILKKKPANDYHQMLPYYEGTFKPKQNNIDFESARRIWRREDDRTVVKRRSKVI